MKTLRRFQLLSLPKPNSGNVGLSYGHASVCLPTRLGTRCRREYPYGRYQDWRYLWRIEFLLIPISAEANPVILLPLLITFL